MWNYKNLYLIIFLSLLLFSCEDHSKLQPSKKVVLPITITLPIDATFDSSQAPARRVIGDPGKNEKFLLPNYIYIIILKQVGENWVLWHQESNVLTREDWDTTRYVGSYNTPGDLIYQYTGKFNFLLNNEDFNGRVYAMASAEPLSFNRSLSSITSLSDVESLTFDASSSIIQENLEHIYSTPYNYLVAERYYASFSTAGERVPHVSLQLYHVAAKVDIKWSVAENKRINKETPSSAVRLTYMDACHLFNDMAYCFKPMENVLPAKSASATTRSIVRPENEGLWWEGRSYFYTIPYTVSGVTNYFPLQMVLKTNDSSGTGYKPTLNLKIDTSTPFVPWLRATFNLSEPLTDKEETKTIDN